jgi:hypothetical protein
MQFHYQLRQKDARKDAPWTTSFASSAGKLIEIRSSVAARNDRNIKRGKVRQFFFLIYILLLSKMFLPKSIHKTLEKAIGPSQVRFKTINAQERWGLR